MIDLTTIEGLRGTARSLGFELVDCDGDGVAGASRAEKANEILHGRVSQLEVAFGELLDIAEWEMSEYRGKREHRTRVSQLRGVLAGTPPVQAPAQDVLAGTPPPVQAPAQDVLAGTPAPQAQYVLLHGAEVHFGGTAGECAAFLVGWGALRARVLGDLLVASSQVSGQVAGWGNGLQGAAMSRSLPDGMRSSVASALPVGMPEERDFARELAAARVHPRDPRQAMTTVMARQGGDMQGASMPSMGAARGSARGGRGLARGPGGNYTGELAGVRVLPRDQRQGMITAWAEAAFGREEATGLPQRGLRLLEEAIEAFQACGGNAEISHELVTYVFNHPPGMLGQELGGVAISVLAMAAAAGLSADEEECREIHRVLSRPLGEFTRRNGDKNNAGFKIGDDGTVLRCNPCCGNVGTHGEGRCEYCSTCGAELGARTCP